MKCQCGKNVTEYLTIQGKNYCDHCRQGRLPTCDVCKRIINDSEFIESDSKAYHKDCYEHVALYCYVCKKMINGRYLITEAGPLCLTCNNPKLKCFSCNAQLTQQSLLKLGDHRVICAPCSATAVYNFEPHHFRIVKNIFDFFGCKVNKDITITIVDYPELVRLIKQKIQGTCMGVCSTQHFGVFHRQTILRHDIYILFGLPETQFIGVLAHEMFHAWLNENSSEKSFLTHDDIEWLCDSIATEVIKIHAPDPLWINHFSKAREKYNVTFSLRNALQLSNGKQIVAFLRQRT